MLMSLPSAAQLEEERKYTQMDQSEHAGRYETEEQEAKMLHVSIKLLNVSRREMEPGRPSKVEIK